MFTGKQNSLTVISNSQSPAQGQVDGEVGIIPNGLGIHTKGTALDLIDTDLSLFHSLGDILHTSIIVKLLRE
jgi:hypothetical protein